MPTTKSILTKSKDWASFKRAVDPLDNKTKGDAFEDLAQHFFQIDPKYRTKLKNVWNVNKREVPSRIHRKLNLPNPDLGIDLLAETAEGEFWAIQCKYHSDQSKSLTKSEIDSCMNLAFGHCKGISLAVVCTSAEKYSRHLKDYAKEKLTYCDGSVWRRLDENFFKAVRKNLKGQSQPIKALKPRPHQKRAIKNALDHFVAKKNERGKMIMPCGSGKSLTGYWIADKFKAKKILVAVPSLALIKQTLEVWAEQSVANKKDVRWICVCSDKSVGNISNDDVAVQLQDLGIKIHTKPAEIASWLKKRSSATTVVFTTYQSGEAIATASKKAKYNFDLGICDEAHKTVGAKGKAFSHLLYEKNIKVKRRLFMTATERRYGGSTDKVISMDDHDLYGETFELLSFKEALECKPAILSDYKIITIGVTQQEIRENIKKNILVKPSKVKWNKETEIQMLTAALALRKAIKLKGIKHAVSFHSSIARAEAFRETQDNLTKHISGFGKLDTFHVSGKLPTADREKRLNEFAESKRSLITNARCLTEGVDVKQIDCVVFADPKKSAVDIVQAVGRALRPFDGKKYGYVIVPQLIDAKSVKGRIEQNESFRDILMTLRALASNDERIVEYFRSISEGKRIPKRNAPVEFVTPIGTKIDYKQFENDLKLKVWGRLAKLSWRPFEEAKIYVNQLNIQTRDKWSKLYKDQKLPQDIPAFPSRVYKNKGWVDWPDWLGTDRIGRWKNKKRPFEEAKEFARNLKLKDSKEWIDYCNGITPHKEILPNDIPPWPHDVYKKEGWEGWGDWLGTGTIASFNKVYWPYEKARKHILKLKLKDTREWNEYKKTNSFPVKIPKAPQVAYKDKGWIGIYDWLGIQNRYRKIWPFKKARRFVRSLNLQSFNDWRRYHKSEIDGIEFNINLPTSPAVKYKNEGWQSWGDWLGTGIVATANRKYPPFADARKYAQSLKLKNIYEWREYTKRKDFPKDIPKNPDRPYKNDGWLGYGDWLGTKTTLFRSFSEARSYARKLGFKNQEQWYQFCRSDKKPMDIPTYPSEKYKNGGWKNWGDWLGTGNVAVFLKEFRPFEEARSFVRSLNLKSTEEWKEFVKTKRSKDIPSTPEGTYKGKGWINYSDWLGNPINHRKEYKTYLEARKYVRKQKLKTYKDWNEYKNSKDIPDFIPKYPERTYKKDGWVGIGDWIGSEHISYKIRSYRTFKEARSFARNLGLINQKEWFEFAKTDKKPSDIPCSPQPIYKDKGWVNWGDWLGTDFTATYLRGYKPFKDANSYVAKLQLKSVKDWRRFCKSELKPNDLPSSPDRFYKDKGWKGWDHFLGKTKIR